MTPFYIAVAKENIKIIKLLLTNKNIDINIMNEMNEIFNFVFFLYYV